MELFNYLLKVSACSALFFAFYVLVLRKLTFFKINRFYLLFSMVISFIIPALQFTIERLQNPIVKDIDGIRYGSYVNNMRNTLSLTENAESLNFVPLLSVFYVLIAVGFLSFAAVKLFRLLNYTRLKTSEINGLKVVRKATGFTNCSFFNYVFIDENSLTDEELHVLLKHEEVHAKELHSIDKILLMVLKSVLWFNPVIYLYDKMLEEAHEFEADRRTSENFGTKSYAQLLLKLAVAKSEMPLVHNFVKSPLKQRIKMLFNSKSNNMKRLAYLLALPIALCLIWGFTVKVVYATPSPKSIPYINAKNSIPIDSPTTPIRIITKKQSTKTLQIQAVAVAQEVPNVKIIPTTEFKKDERSIYTRYPYINKKGEACDMVEIRTAGGSSAAVEVKKNGKAIIIINGIQYSEEDMKVMSKDKIANINSISAVDDYAVKKYYPELAEKFDGVIELPARLSFN